MDRTSQKQQFKTHHNHSKGSALNMKTTIRIFALTVALTGLVASSFSPASVRLTPCHLSAVSSDPGPLSLPIPTCGPGVPFCGGGGIVSSSF